MARRVAYDGEKFAASIQARANFQTDVQIEKLARLVNSTLAQFVNGRIDQMFVEGIGKRGLTKQTAMAPPELMRNTTTTWGSLTPSTVRKKKARRSTTPDTIYRDTGDFEKQLSKLPSGKSISQVFGGYSNKSARVVTGQPANLTPNRAGGKAPRITKTLTFSVFHALKSRAVPETIMDLLYDQDANDVPMSVKLGYYAPKNKTIRHRRSLLVPYADYFVRVQLPMKVKDWVRKQARN